MIKIDLHIHGAPWENDWAAYRRSVWHAWRAGCEYIGISEHGPRFNHRAPYRSLYFCEFDRYFDTLDEIKLEFKGAAEVLTGLELDYNEWMVEHYRDLLPELPLDFIVGSVHTVKDWVMGVDDSFEESSLSGLDSAGVYEAYFEELMNAARTGLFDFIAHPDLVKRYLPRLGFAYPANPAPIYQRAVEMLRACEVGIEINTRGLLSAAGEYYPNDDFLRECAHAGIPLTIGSDSHDMVSAGLGVAEAMAHAWRIGFKQIHIWRKRERVALNI